MRQYERITIELYTREEAGLLQQAAAFPTTEIKGTTSENEATIIKVTPIDKKSIDKSCNAIIIGKSQKIKAVIENTKRHGDWVPHESLKISDRLGSYSVPFGMLVTKKSRSKRGLAGMTYSGSGLGRDNQRPIMGLD